MGNFPAPKARYRAGFDLSPRFSSGEGKRGQGRSTLACRPGSEGQSRASLGTLSRRSGSTRVARTGASGSHGARTWLACVAICIVFWAIFLGSLLAVGAFGACHTHRCFHRVHNRRAQHWLRVHRPWVYAWRHLSAHERSWARCIASYETRGVPWNRKARVATGNHYEGATQWLLSTWHAAGGSGRPSQHSLDEQLVRTVRWAHTAGSSQWSTSRICGVI